MLPLFLILLLASESFAFHIPTRLRRGFFHHVSLDEPRVSSPPRLPEDESPMTAVKSIVLITGFEAFNIALYRKAAQTVMQQFQNKVKVSVFTDVDINDHPAQVESALQQANVLFTSLLFDYNQINWIRNRIQHIPTRFCFECALELMQETQVGDFQMKGGGMKGPPPPVKAILSQFGSQKEEDRMTGYLKFLKIGPKFLDIIPSDKFQNLKTWLTVYSYWNEGGLENVVSMLYLIIRELKLVDQSISLSPPKVKETPLSALYHPLLDKFIQSPKEYVRWYEQTHPWVNENTARVGILLYRKHVITGQDYIGNLIKLMESEGMFLKNHLNLCSWLGIMPIPVFINGVEAHTVVRDWFTTKYEMRYVNPAASALDQARVDVIVNTIGFPLVGGPGNS